MSYKLFKFAEELAELMGKYEMQIAAVPVPTENIPFAYISFQSGAAGVKHAFPNMERCHVSAYDLRTQCLGMTSKEANDFDVNPIAKGHN